MARRKKTFEERFRQITVCMKKNLAEFLFFIIFSVCPVWVLASSYSSFSSCVNCLLHGSRSGQDARLSALRNVATQNCPQ